jgi:hypothetical protein
MEPKNTQAQQLGSLIDDKVRSGLFQPRLYTLTNCTIEGLVGMAIVGGAVAVIGAVALAIFGSNNKFSK